MKGKMRPVSVGRRLVIDLMHASVPLVIIKRTMRLERLAAARNALTKRPGWTPIIAKAFCIVARDEPSLRSYYLKWPWPHLYELPRSMVMAPIIHDSFDPDVPLLMNLGCAEDISLAEMDATLKHCKTAPLDEVPALRRVMRVTRLPLPLRRLLWSFSLNVGRHRANNFGTVAITSLASLGSETVVANSPGPSLITYGLIRADHTMELLLHWDHRIFDGVLACRALQRLEEVLNGEIADEMLAAAG